MYRSSLTNLQSRSSKDAALSQLKTQVEAFKDLQGDFLSLNNQIALLESKYSLLLDQKERLEKDSKIKLQSGRKVLVNLRVKIDQLKLKICQKVQAAELAEHQNSVLYKQVGLQETQITDFTSQNTRLDEQRANVGNDSQYIISSIATLKQERNGLEREADQLSAVLDKEIEKLKVLEKDCRGTEAAICITRNNLEKVERECNVTNTGLQALGKELDLARDREAQADRKSQQLSGKISALQNEEFVAIKNKTDVSQKLEAQANANREALIRLKAAELSEKEADENTIRENNQREVLIHRQSEALTMNKKLSGEVDRFMQQILELERVNSGLVYELTKSSQIDEQIVAIIRRKQRVDGVLTQVANNIAKAHQPISRFQ